MAAAAADGTGARAATDVEVIAGLDVTQHDVPVPTGDTVRLIVTRPKLAAGPLPVAFLVGWLSCDSVNWPKGPPFGLAQAFIQIARETGFVTVRMDKPGVGASRGADCAQLDFERELAAYRAALDAALRLPGVDGSKVFMVGMSNGGGFAPLVARDRPVKGYVVIGGWVKTWFEHMLEHERRRLTLLGKSPADINVAMAHFETFYHAFLIDRMAPGDVVRAHPEIKQDWYDAPDGQYGRPAAFYQQLQALNLAQAWQKVAAPTLVIHGEYDWIMSRSDHEIIAAIVAGKGAALAAVIEAPRTSHLLEVLPDAGKAYEGRGPLNVEVSNTVVKWLREHAGP
ncbi:MAG: alpha/beta hydrolase [Caldimonas sp.]